MPSRPLRVCGAPGCGRLVKSGRCPEHTVKQSDRRQHDPEQRRFYSSGRWTKLSRMIRSRDPICRICEDAPSKEADHIDGNWRNNDPRNLRGVCGACHRKRSGRDHRRG